MSRGASPSRRAHRAPDGGRRVGEACPLGVCDGSGFVVDEATNTATDCGCRAGRIARRAHAQPRRAHPAPLPRASPSTARRSATSPGSRPSRSGRCAATCATSSGTSTPAGGCGSRATWARARRRSRCSSPKRRSTPGARWRSTRFRACSTCCASRWTAEGACSTSWTGSTAVDLLHIDDLGAENHDRLGARAAVLDRQRPLRGRAGDRGDDQPDARRARPSSLGARTVSRLVEICGDLIPLFGEDKRREFRAGGESLAPEAKPRCRAPRPRRPP